MSISGEPLVMERALLGAATETTKGTEETVSQPLQNSIVYNLDTGRDDVHGDGTRAPENASSGELPPERGPKINTWSFTTAMIYGDEFFGTLGQGCGLALGAGPPQELSIEPHVDAQKSLTLYAWEDGILKKLVGAAGTFTMRAGSPRAMGMIDWQFTGLEQAVTDVSMVTDPNVSTAAMKAESLTLTLGGSAIPPVDGFTLTMNNTIEMREDTDTAEGIAYHYAIVGVPTLELAPEAMKVANYDTWGKHFGDTAEALVLTVPNPNGSGSWQVDAPAALRTSVGQGNRGRKKTAPITLGLYVSSADDQIKFTENT